VIHQSRSVSIPACGSSAARSFGLDPLEGIGIEDSEVTVILLAVIAPEDVELLVVESGCMILNLRSVRN
jgi:hypothetical protein